MAEKPKIRLVFCKSSPALKVILLALIVLSTAALLSLRSAITDARAQGDAVRAQADALEQENTGLEQAIAELGSAQSIVRIATEELGLVDPDTVFFIPGN